MITRVFAELCPFVCFHSLFLNFSRGGKDCALKLNLLPPGTVTSEVVLDGEHLV